MERWDVILVGAGFGGLCTGALLARAGRRVLVLEKEGTIGGRAKTVLHAGHVLDDGAHIPSRAGHLEGIFRDLGLRYPDVVPLEKSEIYHDGRWKNPKELFTGEMYKRVLAEMNRLTPEELASLDDTPLRDWVEKISDEPGIQMLFFYLGCATSVGNRFETYSTGEMVSILQEFLRAGRRLNELAGVVRGGMKAILEPLAQYIRTHGGEVRLNCPVESVEIRDGQAVGVNIERGRRIFHGQILDVEAVEADFVVVTLPLWDLFSVLDESRLPRWWTDWVSWLSGKVSYAWSVIYALDDPLFDVGTFRWAPNLPHSGFSGIFFPMPTYGDHAGQFQFHVSYQGHYDEMPDLLQPGKASVRRKARELIALLERESVELFPSLAKGWRWRVAHAGVYGIAQSPGFVGYKRPSMRVPGLRNLFVVSNTVREARGISMSAVGKCARMAAEAILAES